MENTQEVAAGDAARWAPTVVTPTSVTPATVRVATNWSPTNGETMGAMRSLGGGGLTINFNGPVFGDPRAFEADVRVHAAIARAAQATGTDFSYLLAQARIESGLNPAARAATSSTVWCS